MAMSSSGGSWKSLFYFALAAAGRRLRRVRLPRSLFQDGARGGRQPVGDRRWSAGGRRIGGRRARQAEDRTWRSSRRRPRRQIRGDTKTEGDGRHARDAAQARALEAMGGTVAGDGTMVAVSFPAAKLIDANGIDVSDAGLPAIKILAEATKKESAKVRIQARVVLCAADEGAPELVPQRGRDERHPRRARDVRVAARGPGARAHHHHRGHRREGCRARGPRQEGRRRRSRSGRARDRDQSSGCAASGAWRCWRS